MSLRNLLWYSAVLCFGVKLPHLLGTLPRAQFQTRLSPNGTNSGYCRQGVAATLTSIQVAHLLMFKLA